MDDEDAHETDGLIEAAPKPAMIGPFIDIIGDEHTFVAALVQFQPVPGQPNEVRVTCPSGTVHLKCSPDDFRRALEEALA